MKAAGGLVAQVTEVISDAPSSSSCLDSPAAATLTNDPMKCSRAQVEKSDSACF